jgi:hypothetical protein
VRDKVGMVLAKGETPETGKLNKTDLKMKMKMKMKIQWFK